MDTQLSEVQRVRRTRDLAAHPPADAGFGRTGRTQRIKPTLASALRASASRGSTVAPLGGLSPKATRIDVTIRKEFPYELVHDWPQSRCRFGY
jgi:hypothetical protein